MLNRDKLCVAGLSIVMLCAVEGCKPSSRSQVAPTKTAPEVTMGKTDIAPEEARNLLDANIGYIYLDVRSVQEFDAGRPPGAINIPIAEPNPSTGQMESNPNFLQVVESTIPHDAKVIVGCRSGARSARARDMLRSKGYSDVVNMAGGFGGGPGPGGQAMEPGWSASGYPVEKGDAGERSYQSISKTEPSP